MPKFKCDILSNFRTLWTTSKTGFLDFLYSVNKVKMSAKKLINNVDNVVDEALDGLIATNPNVTSIENHRVIVRSDLENLQGKVGIIAGGGSGHEPAFASYVGKGCLSSAIAGSVFASPPPTPILASILTLAKYEPSGILVIVYNYTGDRVNFGIALERARSLTQVPCEIFVVADDTALTSADRTAGRRGLCGGKLVLKIAGALSERGKSLDEILDILQSKVSPNLGTIGLSLGPCVVPGRTKPSFELQDDEMELGLGMHGEAGVRRVKLASAKQTVEMMLDHMTNPDSATHLQLNKGDTVAVVLNNLGAISSLEMGILTNEVVTQMKTRQVVIRRFYSGPLFTSLEMPGFSITVLKLASEMIIQSLDDEALCSGWSAQAFPRDLSSVMIPKLPDPILALNKSIPKGPRLNKTDQVTMLNIVTNTCQALIAKEDLLNVMDSGSGDSDCGSTIRRGSEAVLLNLENNAGISEWPSELFHMIGKVAETDMGGSSGAMYSLLFEAAAVQLERYSSSNITLVQFAEAFASGLLAMQKYGHAQEGDRTMIDALAPALKTFQANAGSKELYELLEDATKAAEDGAKATLKMKAFAGRASYVPVSELKHPDPGAHAIGITMRAIFEGFKIKANEVGMN